MKELSIVLATMLIGAAIAIMLVELLPDMPMAAAISSAMVGIMLGVGLEEAQRE